MPNPPTNQEIFRRLVSRVVARTALTDVEPGGQVATILAGVAREIDATNFEVTQLQRVWDIDTATGRDLDRRALDYNPDRIGRLGATKATGSGKFSRTGTTGTVTIPAGSQVYRTSDKVRYRTTEVATIADGDGESLSTAIEAVTAGEDGNCDAGAIDGLDPVAGVAAFASDVGCIGGRDEESDPEFRTRMKLYARSLSRGTPDALKYAVLGAAVDGYGRVVACDVVEGRGTDLGKSWLYIDDGSGTVEVSEDVAGEEVVTAVGGELRLSLAHVAVVTSQPVTVTWTPISTGTPVELVEDDDFELDYPAGKIRLIPGGSSTIPTSGLAAGDIIEADYTRWVGLIEEAQKIVEGVPEDREDYPGYRAAGTQVFVLAPRVYQQIVTGVLTLEPGYDRETVVGSVNAAISRYINGLGINGDVIYSELIYMAQAVPGVFDFQLTSPTTNVVIGEGELARVRSENITISAA